MIVGIDGNEANIEKKVGVNRYALEVLRGLYKLQDDKNRFVIYLSDKPRTELPDATEFWKYKILHGGKAWVLSKLMPHLIRHRQVDVLFSPSHYLPIFNRIPTVCTIHDLGYLEFSEQFRKRDFWQLKYWSAISIIISKYIICPSESVKKEIVRHYPFASKKIYVVHHGFDKQLFHKNINNKIVRQIRDKYRIEKKYILFLSTLKPSKNVEGLIDAYYMVKNKIDHQLVIAGKKGWMYEEIFRKVKELQLEDDVVFTDYIPEKDKPALFVGAKAYVLPSFWEGFGMDVLNAMACGTPVVVSKVASLPEIAGDAAIYINPYKIESIAKGITKIVKMNEKRYNNLVNMGLDRAESFSWDKSARETLDVLRKVA
jgi:glycosyltransferase involved in cell wall biosynthesis